MQNFDEIRPFNDSEVPAAVRRVISNVYFPWLANTLSPEKSISEIKKNLSGISTVQDFQEKISFSVLQKIIDNSISNFTYSGCEYITSDKQNLFISNHRDIVLDAALLNYAFWKEGIPQTEITFGSNLTRNEISTDLAKINRMFRIIRKGNLRDLYNDYIYVSNYIRYVITEKKRSVWIAQRNGRTKDGNDKTEAAVLKMFAMASEKSFVENLSELNITPVSVSYEFEPCAFMKAAELFVSLFTKYVKGKNEDYQSILQGIQAPKGHVNFAITQPITIEELEQCAQLDKSEMFNKLAQIIDKRIYEAYTLEKNNYIAYDAITKTETYAEHYSAEDKKIFFDYLANGIDQLNTPKSRNDMESIVLNIYANPIRNKLAVGAM